MINTPYQNLAQAIIVKAVHDYRKALRGHGYYYPSASKFIVASQIIAECEQFFRSDWFMVLTNLDGEMLIEKLRQEVYSE